ncbi:50S ribosomal protein L4 [Candidatus Collierbacteria bacterium]|nr:50S ribosomal protein L4 [Candidatus Collierbacteria bacterium]
MATKKTTPAKKRSTAVKKETGGAIKLDPTIFNISVSDKLISQALHVYRTNVHQETSKAKTRGEVVGTTKKIYRQKGTGGARHGARSAPIFVGGGVAHGPKGIKAQRMRLNQKMKAKALAGVLSLMAKDNRVSLVNPPSNLDHSLKESLKVLSSLNLDQSTLLVYFQDQPQFLRPLSNLKNLKLASAANLNLYQVAKVNQVVLTTSAHQSLVNRLTPLLEKSARS